MDEGFRQIHHYLSSSNVFQHIQSTSVCWPLQNDITCPIMFHQFSSLKVHACTIIVWAILVVIVSHERQGPSISSNALSHVEVLAKSKSYQDISFIQWMFMGLSGNHWWFNVVWNPVFQDLFMVLNWITNQSDPQNQVAISKPIKAPRHWASNLDMSCPRLVALVSKALSEISPQASWIMKHLTAEFLMQTNIRTWNTPVKWSNSKTQTHNV